MAFKVLLTLAHQRSSLALFFCFRTFSCICLEGVHAGAFHENIVGAGPQEIDLLDDLGELLDPDIVLHTIGSCFGIELERDNIASAHGEDQDIVLLKIRVLQEIPVVSLVIEDQEGLVLLTEFF